MRPTLIPAKTVAFLTNQLGIRGTERVIYLLADACQTHVGWRPIIVVRLATMDHASDDQGRDVIDAFIRRFEHVLFVDDAEIEDVMRQHSVDLCYICTAGWPGSSVVPRAVPTLAHCVFTGEHDLGATVHCGISDEVSRRVAPGHTQLEQLPTLPNPVDLCYDVPGKSTVRRDLGIPEDAYVYGRHGGFDTFDIPFVHGAVIDVARTHPHIHFVFMHTRRFGPPFPNIHFLPKTMDPVAKIHFIDACDAMIHGRHQGETFGMAVAEFSVRRKPVLTWNGSVDRYHLDILGDAAIAYDESTIHSLLQNTTHQSPPYEPSKYYWQFTLDRVMPVFRELVNVTCHVFHKHVNQ